MDQPRFIGKRIILAVTGSIAAYKSVELLRSLTREGADVHVVMTTSATQFIAPLTFEVLSKHQVLLSLFDHHEDMPHLSLPEQADAILIAPATANTLAQSALGLAGDLLGTILLNASCPLIFAPAMDGDMWSHQTVQTHVRTLRERHAVVLEPEEGLLASGAYGKGRLPSEPRILTALQKTLAYQQDFSAHRLLISAGPTQEAIDPVRYISNRSSGKMGYALAQAARERGAQVKLISGPTGLPCPAGIDREQVVTAEEMGKAMEQWFSWSTVTIMCAAVADFRPKHFSTKKLSKKADLISQMTLEPTEDILQKLSEKRSHQIMVGFAAQTESVSHYATEKLQTKNLDLIIGNQVGVPESGFDSDTNSAVLITKTGETTPLANMSKRRLADHILNSILTLSVSSNS